jgi:hypothetical protein
MGQTTGELRADLERQRSELSHDLEAIGDRVSPSRIAQRRTASLRSGVQRAKDAVMGTATAAPHAATEQIGEVAGRAGETVSQVPDAARQQVQGNPLAAGLLAFSAGLVVATLLPETPPERQLARQIQPKLEDAASAVGSAAQEMREHLEPAAKDAAAELRDTAKESVSAVRDEAQQAGSTVAEEAKPASPTSSTTPSI